MDEVIQKIIDVLKKEDPQRVYLFGSRATGTARPDSDYDIMMIKEHDERNWHDEGLRVYRKLVKEISQPLDFVLYTPEKFDRYKNVNGLIIYDAYNKGKLIYERNGL